MCLALQQFAGEYGDEEIKFASKNKMIKHPAEVLHCCITHVLLCDTGQGYTRRWIERC